MHQSCLQTPSRKHKVHGFGLIELMVTITITGILLTIAIPSMNGFLARWQVNDAINTFSSSLRVARAEAIKRGRAVYMCRSDNGESCATGMPMDGWKSGWIIYVDNNGTGTYNAAIDVLLKVQDTLSSIDAVTSTAGTLTNFRFSSTGMLFSGMQGMNFTSNQQSGGQAVAKRGLCISRTGRTRSVADGSTDCGSL